MNNQELCENKIWETDSLDSMKSMKNKTLGNDWLTKELYETF